jgi:hypothetical protein
MIELCEACLASSTLGATPEEGIGGLESRLPDPPRRDSAFIGGILRMLIAVLRFGFS